MALLCIVQISGVTEVWIVMIGEIVRIVRAICDVVWLMGVWGRICRLGGDFGLFLVVVNVSIRG